ncbi:MAG TPA: flagellar hook capping FlgD N-terminal domain-containing protein [Candidatus Aquilonibacter sp.]|nr:flagellar hook capping FlgD N-terminal domain-containing protein [Candidatus Aquilonibacter sp.]
MVSGIEPNASRMIAEDSTSGSPATSGSGSSNSNSTGSSQNTAQQDTSEFISILSAELQSQDPTQPLDPTTFVTQLAQFSSLDELINLRSDFETAFGIANTNSSNLF